MIYTADKYIHRSERFSIWAYSDVSAEDFDVDITIFFENKTYVCTMYAAGNIYSHFEKNPEESFFWDRSYLILPELSRSNIVAAVEELVSGEFADISEVCESVSD